MKSRSSDVPPRCIISNTATLCVKGSAKPKTHFLFLNPRIQPGMSSSSLVVVSVHSARVKIEISGRYHFLRGDQLCHFANHIFFTLDDALSFFDIFQFVAHVFLAQFNVRFFFRQRGLRFSQSFFVLSQNIAPALAQGSKSIGSDKKFSF